MTLRINPRRLFVAGATGFLGAGVAFALLEAGAEVTALVPPGAEFRLGRSEGVRVVEGDAWNPGSLVGRSRGHGAVIHLVGSLRQQPARGLTYDYLNVTSTRNIIRMAARDGVPHMIYLSAAWAPWLPGGYVESKRRAEGYLRQSGLAWTVVRAPLVYPRGQLRNPLLWLISAWGQVPLLGWPLARWAPLPVDVMARGIAALALAGESSASQIVYGRQLRRLSKQHQRARAATFQAGAQPSNRSDQEDDLPFGWLP